MGLFKKKNKNDDKEQVQNVPDSISQEEIKKEKKDEMEILEFDEKDKDIKQEIKKFNNRENRLIFGIILLLIVFAMFLPTITSFVSKNSMFTYNRVVEDITSVHTVDGMLEIGKDEGSITVKKIKFYNSSKKRRNEIQIVYLPETGIKNVKDLNIYIELYNSNKNIIYRTSFDVNNLERKVQGNYTMSVDEKIYSEAVYAKVTIIKDEEFNKSKDTLVCTNDYEDGIYGVEEKVIYNFSDKGLITYEVSREVKINGDDDNSDKYAKLFEKEAKELSETNASNVDYDNDFISYSIDLRKFDSGKSGYDKLYDLGNVKRQVKLSEEAKNWSCK